MPAIEKDGREIVLSGMRFHHLGFAARDPAVTSRFLALLGYTIGPIVRDPLQNVDLCYCAAASGPDIELVSPTETAGPVDRILAEHGDHIYHVCYEVECIDSALANLKGQTRVLPVVPPKPAVLFDGYRVGFYHLAGFGLIELLEIGQEFPGDNP